MSWITWATILVAWPLVGLGMTYLFGRFTHGAEIPGNADDLAPPVLSYLRFSKRAKESSRPTVKARRGTAGARRSH